MIPHSRPKDRAFLLRYGMAVGICAVLHNSILVGATVAGAGVLAAAALSFSLMVVIGYLFMCLLAFQTSPTLVGFARYFLAMSANFPLTTGLLWLFAVPLKLPVVLVAPSVTVLMVGVNFLWARWAISRARVSCAS